MAKKAKTLEELDAEQKRLWDLCEDLYQQAHEAERKAKSAWNKYKRAKETIKP